jgi:hypothetical protein
LVHLCGCSHRSSASSRCQSCVICRIHREGLQGMMPAAAAPPARHSCRAETCCRFTRPQPHAGPREVCGGAAAAESTTSVDPSGPSLAERLGAERRARSRRRVCICATCLAGSVLCFALALPRPARCLALHLPLSRCLALCRRSGCCSKRGAAASDAAASCALGCSIWFRRSNSPAPSRFIRASRPHSRSAPCKHCCWSGGRVHGLAAAQASHASKWLTSVRTQHSQRTHATHGSGIPTTPGAARSCQHGSALPALGTPLHRGHFSAASIISSAQPQACNRLRPAWRAGATLIEGMP